MTVRHAALVLAAASLVAAGCGGGGDAMSSVSAKDRIAACLEKQPDASKGECEGWEKDGQLADDGTHEDHQG